MTEPTSSTKHVPSSLARQTLLDRDLTRPVTDRPPIGGHVGVQELQRVQRDRCEIVRTGRLVTA